MFYNILVVALCISIFPHGGLTESIFSGGVWNYPFIAVESGINPDVSKSPMALGKRVRVYTECGEMSRTVCPLVAFLLRFSTTGRLCARLAHKAYVAVGFLFCERRQSGRD